MLLRPFRGLSVFATFLLVTISGVAPVHAEKINRAITDVLAAKEPPEEEAVSDALVEYAMTQLTRKGIDIKDDFEGEYLATTFAASLMTTPCISRFPHGTKGREVATEISRLQIRTVCDVWPMVNRPNRSEYMAIQKQTEVLAKSFIAVLGDALPEQFAEEFSQEAIEAYSRLRNRAVANGILPFFKSILTTAQVKSLQSEFKRQVVSSKGSLESALRVNATDEIYQESVVRNWVQEQMVFARSLEKSSYSADALPESQLQEVKNLSNEMVALLKEFHELDIQQAVLENKAAIAEAERQVANDNLRMKQNRAKNKARRKNLQREKYLAQAAEIRNLVEGRSKARQEEKLAMSEQLKVTPEEEEVVPESRPPSFRWGLVSVNVLVIAALVAIVIRSRRSNTGLSILLVLTAAVLHGRTICFANEYLEKGNVNQAEIPNISNLQSYIAFRLNCLYEEHRHSSQFDEKWPMVNDALSAHLRKFFSKGSAEFKGMESESRVSLNAAVRLSSVSYWFDQLHSFLSVPTSTPSCEEFADILTVAANPLPPEFSQTFPFVTESDLLSAITESREDFRYVLQDPLLACCTESSLDAEKELQEKVRVSVKQFFVSMASFKELLLQEREMSMPDTDTFDAKINRYISHEIWSSVVDARRVSPSKGTAGLLRWEAALLSNQQPAASEVDLPADRSLVHDCSARESVDSLALAIALGFRQIDQR